MEALSCPFCPVQTLVGSVFPGAGQGLIAEGEDLARQLHAGKRVQIHAL